MNKHTLIYLGAFAQKHFHMQEGFRIVELASDSPPTIRVPVSMSFSTAVGGGYYAEYDEIELIKVGNFDERVWIGYSSRANTLAIKESE